MAKSWYESKTIWINSIALVSLIIQTKYGFVVSPEIQTAVLAIVNVYLRKITHEEIK